MSDKKTLIQFKENCLNNELFLSEFYRKYQSTHKKKEFKINEFLIEEFNTQIFLMFTSEPKEISYFGFPFSNDSLCILGFVTSELTKREQSRSEKNNVYLDINNLQ